MFMFNLRVVKIGDLFEVHEDRVFIVTNDSWHFHFRIIDCFHVAINDSLQILTELFFGLQKFTNDGSVECENFQRFQSLCIKIFTHCLRYDASFTLSPKIVCSLCFASRTSAGTHPSFVFSAPSKTRTFHLNYHTR